MKDEVSFFLGCHAVTTAQHFETTMLSHIIGTLITR